MAPSVAPKKWRYVSISRRCHCNGLLYAFTAGASTIGSISMYSGWNDNGRIEQHFSVYTTTDVTVTGASTWTLLATVGGGGSNGSTQFAEEVTHHSR